MARNVPPFTITAECPTGPMRASRLLEYSAMCLADRWDEMGCIDIRIIDGAEVVREREAFRANLPFVRRLQRKP